MLKNRSEEKAVFIQHRSTRLWFARLIPPASTGGKRFTLKSPVPVYVPSAFVLFVSRKPAHHAYNADTET